MLSSVPSCLCSCQCHLVLILSAPFYLVVVLVSAILFMLSSVPSNFCSHQRHFVLLLSAPSCFALVSAIFFCSCQHHFVFFLLSAPSCFCFRQCRFVFFRPAPFCQIVLLFFPALCLIMFFSYRLLFLPPSAIFFIHNVILIPFPGHFDFSFSATFFFSPSTILFFLSSAILFFTLSAISLFSLSAFFSFSASYCLPTFCNPILFPSSSALSVQFSFGCPNRHFVFEFWGHRR